MAFTCTFAHILLMIINAMILHQLNAFRIEPTKSNPEEMTIGPNEEPPLPLCTDQYSVCGYVQLNQFGVSAQPICRCPGSLPISGGDFSSSLASRTNGCPMNWDPFNLNTIAHGFDQYKFCGPAPKLPKCTPNELAYVNYVRMQGPSLQIQQHTNYLTCRCDANRLFVRNDTKYYNYEDSQVIVTTHVCSQTPICNEDDLCSTIARSPESTFVTHKCRCANSLQCPQHSLHRAVDRLEMPKGSMFSFKCERP